MCATVATERVGYVQSSHGVLSLAPGPAHLSFSACNIDSEINCRGYVGLGTKLNISFAYTVRKYTVHILCLQDPKVNYWMFLSHFVTFCLVAVFYYLTVSLLFVLMSSND